MPADTSWDLRRRILQKTETTKLAQWFWLTETGRVNEDNMTLKRRKHQTSQSTLSAHRHRQLHPDSTGSGWDTQRSRALASLRWRF